MEERLGWEGHTGEEGIIVRPLRKRGKLIDLIDSIELEGLKDFTNTHRVREAIHG